MERIVCSKDIKLLEYAGSFRVRWDVTTDEAGVTTCMEEEFTYKPTLDEIRTVIIGYYNKQCDQKILSGSKYEGNTVWLTTENQFNYKVAYDLSYQLTSGGGAFTPITFKFGMNDNPVYKTFNTFDEFSEFYVSIASFVSDTIVEFWGIKDSINWCDYE